MKLINTLAYGTYLFLLVSCAKQEPAKLVNKEDITKKLKIQEVSLLQIRNSYVDLGTLPEDTTVFVNYHLVNMGDYIINIAKVETDCTCTGYTLMNEAILPGDSTLLTLEFNTLGKLGENAIYAILHANTPERLHKVTLKTTVY